MTEDHLKRLERAIAVAVKETVNGKIDALSKKVDDYIETDNAWKAAADPYIKGLANISGTAKLFVWVSLGVTAVLAAYLKIKDFIR